MNKKVIKKKKEVKHDGKEDLEIKKVAYDNNVSQYVLLCMLILLFGLTLYASLVYAGKYYKNKKDGNENAEIIEIKKGNNKVTITNNGTIDKTLTTKDFANGEETIIENINSIELTSDDYENINNKYFDIRYNITNNTFAKSTVATSEIPLLVRFAYSFDKEEWTYINHAISYNDSNITPLTGALYDLSGLKGNIKVETNYKITLDPYVPIKMYWKCETIIKYNDDNLGKNIQAEFRINYKDSD